MGGADQYRCSSSKRVNIKNCGHLFSFKYQVLYLLVLQLLSYVSVQQQEEVEHGQDAIIVTDSVH